MRTSTTLMWPGLSLTRLLVYVMSVSSVTSTKSFLGGRLCKSMRKTDRNKVTQVERSGIYISVDYRFCPLFFPELFCQAEITL